LPEQRRYTHRDDRGKQTDEVFGDTKWSHHWHWNSSAATFQQQNGGVPSLFEKIALYTAGTLRTQNCNGQN
jgi:hypothetical protein